MSANGGGSAPPTRGGLRPQPPASFLSPASCRPTHATRLIPMATAECRGHGVAGGGTEPFQAQHARCPIQQATPSTTAPFIASGCCGAFGRGITRSRRDIPSGFRGGGVLNLTTCAPSFARRRGRTLRQGNCGAVRTEIEPSSRKLSQKDLARAALFLKRPRPISPQTSGRRRQWQGAVADSCVKAVAEPSEGR